MIIGPSENNKIKVVGIDIMDTYICDFGSYLIEASKLVR